MKNSLAWIIGLVLALAVSTAEAQDWAQAMFNHTTHDFGVVARGANVEHRFVFENIYEEDAHIASVSSSCGCSTPTINRQSLKTWEKAEVLVTVDTRGFLGRKDATITVVFDKPFPAEVQLHVHTYIRSDVVVQPGEVAFGSILQGSGAKQSVAVSYAGREDWQINRVECANPNVVAEVAETNRGDGQVGYRLSVQLKPGAPAGYIRDQLVLVTNDYDARAARVPVAVEGLVVAALSARPSPLMMGVAESGHKVTRKLVLQGRTPFRIVTAQCDDPRFQCELSGDDARTVHVVPVSFEAGDGRSGAIHAKLHIETDLTGAKAIDVPVSVQIGSTETKGS
ncbi:MAG: DUF1573 domain-containing protein [Thermoguttaceae bacterium]